ncbi:hypothetical protein MK852_21700 [Shewanella benthica]|uniref:hypothetical protein n=1 Tax=Shewanella benthica TaxID=43661 RepID=UPI0018792A55|nr:hypothetical protein [Shewanella benthica]MBE7216610.1 hypothetical protein [Shewanella benthica]MCL1064737.1 hypothetical protein [Shewanella benthica]
MNYRLGLREITESDIKADCPFMPKKEDFPMHVAAFVEDFNNLDIVGSATESNNIININLIDGTHVEQLRQASISIHQHYWDKLRTTGFKTVT